MSYANPKKDIDAPEQDPDAGKPVRGGAYPKSLEPGAVPIDPCAGEIARETIVWGQPAVDVSRAVDAQAIAKTLPDNNGK